MMSASVHKVIASKNYVIEFDSKVGVLFISMSDMHTDPYDDAHPANLPATVRSSEPTGPGGVPLRMVPTPALTFALGWSVTQPVRAEQYGGFCALVEELMSRPSGQLDHGPVGRYDERTAFGLMMNALPHEIARSIVGLYQAQRGQRWAATGRQESRRS